MTTPTYKHNGMNMYDLRTIINMADRDLVLTNKEYRVLEHRILQETSAIINPMAIDTPTGKIILFPEQILDEMIAVCKNIILIT